jgi:hypothetical protein
MNCRVQLDFSTLRERRLAVSSPRYSEVWPAVDGNTVAFVRVGRRRVRLYARSGLSPAKRLTGGPPRGTPTGLVLNGGTLAYGWSYYEGESLGPESELRIDDVRAS